MSRKLTKADVYARSLITSAIFATITLGMSIYDYSIYSSTGSFQVSNKMQVVWPSLTGKGQFIFDLVMTAIFVIMFLVSFVQLKNETSKNT